MPRSVSNQLPDVMREPSQPEQAAREPAVRDARWSRQFGTLAGIPLRVHVTFLLLLVWIALSHALRGQGVVATMSGLLLVVGIFACVVLHELSHALVARRFGIRTRDITLLPIGGVARLERMPENPRQELLVALAGPATSFAIAGALFGVLAVIGGPSSLESLHIVGGPFLTKLMWINVMLGTFNLLPAFPMDGGRVLRAALALCMDRTRATDVAARIGQAVALLLGVVGLFSNPFLVAIAMFVWIGARSEASLVQLKSALAGAPVSEAMITDFQLLSSHDTLARAVALTVAGLQRDFPVVEMGQLEGLLTHAKLLQALAATGAETPVAAAMERHFETAEPSESLELALSRLQSSDSRALIVLRAGKVVGLLTPDSIAELLTMERALRASRSDAHAQ